MGCGCGGSTSFVSSNANLSMGEQEINDAIVQASWYIANQGAKLAEKKKFGELCIECINCLDILQEMVKTLRCYTYPVPGTINIFGGNATSWEVYYDGILIGSASFAGINSVRATTMAAAINSFVSQPDYKATANGPLITINPVVEGKGVHTITYKAYGGIIDAVIVNPEYDGCFTFSEIKYILDYVSRVVYK